MNNSTFDALAYFQKLKSAGFSEEQAQIQADAIKNALDGRLVTREYLDVRLRELEDRLKYDLTVRLGAIVIGCTTLLPAILPMLLRP